MVHNATIFKINLMIFKINPTENRYAIIYFKIMFVYQRLRMLRLHALRYNELDTVYINFSPCSHHTRPVWEDIYKNGMRRTEMRDEKRREHRERNNDRLSKGWQELEKDEREGEREGKGKRR